MSGYLKKITVITMNDREWGYEFSIEREATSKIADNFYVIEGIEDGERFSVRYPVANVQKINETSYPISNNSLPIIQYDARPIHCRMRKKGEGKPYPKSGCESCGNGGLMGCPYGVHP